MFHSLDKKIGKLTLSALNNSNKLNTGVTARELFWYFKFACFSYF